MEKFKAIRRGHRSAVTRLINRTDEKINQSSEFSAREIRTAIETLETKRDVLKTLDNQIIDVTEIVDMEQEILDTENFNFNVDSTIGRYKEKLEEGNSTQRLVSEHTYPSSYPISVLNQNSNQNHQESSNEPIASLPSIAPTSNFYHKLPKLDLPRFNGDIMSWTTFWDSFNTTIHTNPSLTNIQKFSYLRSQLSHSADQCIAGLALSNANYDQAICLLKERYGDEQHIVDAYMKNLLELPSPSFNSHSLRSFYDSMESSTRGLESLGQSQESFGSLLVPIILQKLPIEMRKHMTRERGKKSWDIRSLREAIAKEMYVEESNGAEVSKDIENYTPTASFVSGAASKSSKMNTKYSPKKSNIKPCVFCNRTHHPSECTEYDTPEKRSAKINKKMLCFNCFGKHKVSECRSKFSCRKCKRRHHTTLCNCVDNGKFENQPKAAVNIVNKEEESTPVATMYTTQNKLTNNRNDVLLKTAISTDSNGVNATITHILLDEGLQKSFVTEELAQRLNLTPCGTSTLSIAAFGDATRNVRNLQKAVVQLETENHKTLPVEVLIVPTIAAPLTTVHVLKSQTCPTLKD